MKYREKFQKYLEGNLEKEETEVIQEDIERIEVILSYMDEKLDKELFEEEPEESGGTQTFQREISKAVEKKFRKYAAASGAVVLIIVIALIFGLSPFLNRICYNPARTKEIFDEKTESAIVYQPFQLPLAVYMELFCGEKGFASANVREEGYGRYTIDVQTQINGKVSHHALELVRNHLYRQDMFWNISDMPGNAFTHDYGYESSCCIDVEEAKKRLGELPETMKIRAALSFEEMKDAEELVEFMTQYEAQYLYIPIEVSSAGGRLGFIPEAVGYWTVDLYSQEEYPYLDLGQYEGEGICPPEVLTEHVISSLKFMLAEDNRKFLEIFDSSVPGENVANPLKYQNALEYVEAQGINGYGIVVFASKEQLLKLLKDESVEGVYMLDSSLDLN